MFGKFFHTILVTGLAGIVLIVSNTNALVVNSWQKQTDGVLFTLDQGKLKVEVASDEIFRHVYSLDSIPSPASKIVIKTGWGTPNFQATEDASTVTITTSKLKAIVTKSNASVKYTDLANAALLTEATSGKSLTSVSGHYEGRFGFTLPANEGIYGFGQSGKNIVTATNNPGLISNLNLRNESFPFYNANRTAEVPFFVSSRGYGVLINCYSRMTITAGMSIMENWATNNVIDYYFVHGPELDSVVSRYRWLTGPAPLFPKAAYGFIQSYCIYSSQAQVVDVVTKYRDSLIPLDYIVQDYMYWTCNGSYVFNGSYPNPTQMIQDIHNKHVSFMISVWPSFAAGCDPNYTTMNSNGYLCSSKDYLGYLYNATIPAASQAYWGMLKSAFWDKGIDAWWFDATDPEILDGTIWSYQYENAYSLFHSAGVYDGQRSVSSDKRVCILTRSSYAGQQRNATIVWSGDIEGNITELKNQVASGLDFCAAGIPYWCTDIGGYQAGASDDCFIRWFEYGTFCPIFRLHGVTHHEIYSQPTAMRTITLAYDKLRYRLMPYIYSLAWMVTNRNYTIMRMLPFDFPADTAVKNCTDQFMFGPALLVNPVVQENTTSRSVYLPAGTWHDFWTGAPTVGGKSITVSVPQDKIPLYARAGAIIPMGPDIQYATERADTIEVRAYPGANGSFTIYEDEGNNYNYEQGKYATIPITYIDNPQNVIVGARSGSFTGMDQKKVFNIVYVKSNHGVGGGKTAVPDCQLIYTGAQVSCSPVGTFGRGGEPGVSFFMRNSMTLKTAGDHIVFEKAFIGCAKAVSVFDLSGRMVAMKNVRKNAVDLRKDLGVPNGVYIVKVKVLR